MIRSDHKDLPKYDLRVDAVGASTHLAGGSAGAELLDSEKRVPKLAHVNAEVGKR